MVPNEAATALLGESGTTPNLQPPLHVQGESLFREAIAHGEAMPRHTGGGGAAASGRESILMEKIWAEHLERMRHDPTRVAEMTLRHAF